MRSSSRQAHSGAEEQRGATRPRKHGGGLVYASGGAGRKKKAGGFPQQVLIAVTPDRLYAFESKVKGGSRLRRQKDEVAVWERAGLRVSSTQKIGLTNVTIESPAEGEMATLVPIGVKDDAVNVELIGALEGAHPAGTACMAIHPQRGGRYWYHWVLIVGGLIL